MYEASNSPPGPAQRCHIGAEGRVWFDGKANLAADQIIAQTENAAPRQARLASAQNQAAEELDALLGFAGWASLKQIHDLAEAFGYSDRTLRRAKEKLGLKTLRTGMQPNQKIFWYRGELDEDSTRADILNQNDPLTLDEALPAIC